MCYQSYIVVGHTQSVKLQILPLYFHVLIHSAKQPIRDISYTNFLCHRFNMLDWPKSCWRGPNSANGAGQLGPQKLTDCLDICMPGVSRLWDTNHEWQLPGSSPARDLCCISFILICSQLLSVDDESLKMSWILSKVWLKYYQMCLLLTHNLVQKVHAILKMPWIPFIVNSSLTITVLQLTVPSSVEHFQKA